MHSLETHGGLHQSVAARRCVKRFEEEKPKEKKKRTPSRRTCPSCSIFSLREDYVEELQFLGGGQCELPAWDHTWDVKKFKHHQSCSVRI